MKSRSNTDPVSSSPAARPDLSDPRTRSGFNPKFFPTANGRAAPLVGAIERNERIILEFLTVYHDLNCRHHALHEARTTCALNEGPGREEECLREIEKVAILRDSLEDCYAPFGVIAEPRVQDGIVTDVTFSFGNVDASGRARSGLFTVSAYVALGAPLESLALKIECKETNPR